MGQVEVIGQLKAAANAELEMDRKVILTVNWTKMDPARRIGDAKVKKLKMTNNADFVPPWSPEFITLATLGTDITDAKAKQLAREQNLPNTAKPLKNAVKLLYFDVKNIGTMVQLKMDKCTGKEAIRICEAAGFTYKLIKVRGARKNAVKLTTEPGVVQVEGAGAGGRLWQRNPNPYGDGETKDLPYTTGGVTTCNLGSPGVKMYFRWRLVLTKGR
jgi:hypothetical protein